MRILDKVEQQREDCKESSVHGEPICTSKEISSFHLRRYVNDVTRHADTGRCASIRPLVRDSGLS